MIGALASALARLAVVVLNRLTGPELDRVRAALFRPDPEAAAAFQRDWAAMEARSNAATDRLVGAICRRVDGSGA